MLDLKSALESVKYNGSNPIDQMNIDLNSQKPIKNTIKKFDELVNELEKLLNEK